MYRDVAAKIEYYRDRIIAEFAKRGLAPGVGEVETRLARINKYLSVFRYQSVGANKLVDTAQINQALADVAIDLLILYRIAYDLSVNELGKLGDFVDAHLEELNMLAEQYEQKNRLETESTSLGKTVLFRSHSFVPSYQDGKFVVPLGKASAFAGSKLSCLFEADNVEPEQVTFRFRRGGEYDEVQPWIVSGDVLYVPGEPLYAFYGYSVPAEQKLPQKFRLQAAGLTPNPNYSYKVFAGENRLASLSHGSDKLIEPFAKDNALSFSGGAQRLEAYLHKATYASFHFSTMPAAQNFNGTEIAKTRRTHRVALEFTENFGFDIQTNGRLFACHETGIVEDGALWYPTGSIAKDFFIEETMPGSPVEYDSVEAVITDPPALPIIRMAAVKQIL